MTVSFLYGSASFENYYEAAAFVSEIRKPFGILAEGLISNKNRGDKTAIELFVAGVRGWEAGLRRQVNVGKSHST